MLSSAGLRESVEDARGSFPAVHEGYGETAIESYEGGASDGGMAEVEDMDDCWRGGSGGGGCLPRSSGCFESMVK